jgi:glycosyltransferase involved in cell wall biosynthesis
MAEADLLTVPSASVVQSLVGNGVNESKIRLVPYGVDTSRFYPSNEAKGATDQFVVLYVGLISAAKGLGYLLEGFAQFRSCRRDKGIKLRLIGPIDFSGHQLLEAYAGMFEYLEAVPNWYLRKYYNEASVFLFPSLSEGSALVSYEAMACGIPLITTSMSGTLVENGVNGLIVPIKNSEAIAEALLVLYDDRKLLQRYGHAAAELIRELEKKPYGERVYEVYRELVCNRCN